MLHATCTTSKYSVPLLLNQYKKTTTVDRILHTLFTYSKKKIICMETPFFNHIAHIGKLTKDLLSVYKIYWERYYQKCVFLALSLTIII